MSQEIIILSKCITLLFRESQLENNTENSADLVKTTVEKLHINDTDIGISTSRNIASGLKDLVIEMCRNPPNHVYDLTGFLQHLRIVTQGDNTLYTAIAQSIEQELAPAVLKRTITNLRKTISDFFREQKAAELVKRASRDLNFGRHNIPDVALYIRNLITELEVASSKTQAKDPGLIRTLDLGDEDSLREVFDDVASSNTDGLVFKLGWKEVNMALQGGPRAGDTVVIGALQHNYKTGFSLSAFAHIPIYNKPKCKDPNKKPLCYRISAEDPLRNNAQFLYQLLKFEETKEKIDVKGVSVEEMVQYVKKRLGVNGYHVLMDEINPSNWTYQSIINRIIELESMGYAVEVLCIDYLYKIPTTGCSQGSVGDDFLDMLSRVRAYCSANGILFITPHQLSTEAKRLLQTIPAEQFLSHIKGGGFFEKTKGLDRIYDIGILIHKVEVGEKAYLNVVIDKHRFPTVVDSGIKNMFLEFPSNGMPIPSNIENENYRIMRKIPKSFASKDDSFFQIG